MLTKSELLPIKIIVIECTNIDVVGMIVSDKVYYNMYAAAALIAPAHTNAVCEFTDYVHVKA